MSEPAPNPTPAELVRNYAVAFDVADRGIGDALAAVSDLRQLVNDGDADQAIAVRKHREADIGYMRKLLQSMMRRLAMMEVAEKKLEAAIDQKAGGGT